MVTDTQNTEKKRPAMEVKNVCFSYGKNEILKGASLKIEKGKVTTIMGANGCGKSTLFSLMTKTWTLQREKSSWEEKTSQGCV